MQRRTVIALAAGIAAGIMIAGSALQCGGAEAKTPPARVEYISVPCQKHHSEPYYKAVSERITQEERDLVAEIVYLEAGNQSLTGQRAVAEVIFNRVLSDKFPDTVTEVIFQKNPIQFSTASSLHKAAPTEEQYRAVEITLSTTDPVLPPDVLFFSTCSNWRTTYEQIGDHYFCY